MAIAWVADTMLWGAADAAKGRAATRGDLEGTHTMSCTRDRLTACRVLAGTCSSCNDAVPTPKLCDFY